MSSHASATPLISIADARARVLDAVRPLDAEQVEVSAAAGRVLASDVRAAGDVPPFPCSAMDGYAIVAGDAGRRLTVVGEARAGAPAGQALGDGEAIRISTGAAIPHGATAVIPQEQTERDGLIVVTRAASAAGEHVRGAGEDMATGAIVLAAGTELGAIELGAAVAAGAARLDVARIPRVAVLTTGDELRPAGAKLGPGEIHNSNAPMLSGLARACGADVTTVVHLPDDAEATVAELDRALSAHDALVVSGGMSVGPHDHVKGALARLGVRESFWGVALQPGKPTWFGVAAGDTLVFGLPGNPVSSVVTFSLFAAPALAALRNAPVPRPQHHQARLGVAVRRNPRRMQAIRVTLRVDDAGDPALGVPAGSLVAHPTGAQGSHILTSLLDADALALIPPGDGELAAGTVIELEAFVR